MFERNTPFERSVRTVKKQLAGGLGMAGECGNFRAPLPLLCPVSQTSLSSRDAKR
jgi:hypothetical protein